MIPAKQWNICHHPSGRLLFLFRGLILETARVDQVCVSQRPPQIAAAASSRRGAEDRLDLLIRSCQRAACSYTGGPAALGLGSTAPCCTASCLSKWVTHRLPSARFWLAVMTLTADVVCCNWRVLAGKLNNGYTLAFPPGEAGEW